MAKNHLRNSGNDIRARVEKQMNDGEIMFAEAKTRFFKVLSVNGNRALQFLSSVESLVVE